MSHRSGTSSDPKSRGLENRGSESTIGVPGTVGDTNPIGRAGFFGTIFQDSKQNSPKVRIFLALFRIASMFDARKKNPCYRILYYFANALYCTYSDMCMGGAELPAGTAVGRNLAVHHGYGMVVGKEARIHDNVILRQGITIGNYINRAGRLTGNPEIGSDVELGAGACVLGGLKIGNGAFIGAHAVVYKDVPAGARVYPGPSTLATPPAQRGPHAEHVAEAVLSPG